MDDRTALQHRLGMAVRDARSRRGLSIEAAAKDAGISPVTWRRVERGQGVYEPTMRKVESYFDLPDGSIESAFTSPQAMTAFVSRLLDSPEPSPRAIGDLRRNSGRFVRPRAEAPGQNFRSTDLTRVAKTAATVLSAISPRNTEEEREWLIQRVVHEVTSNDDAHTLENIYTSISDLLIFYDEEIAPSERDYGSLVASLIELAKGYSSSPDTQSDVKEAESTLANLEGNLSLRRTVLLGFIRGMQTSVATILVRKALEE